MRWEIRGPSCAALASPNTVDVASSDRHTVKPWFQGKIPFTFNLPELQNTEFTLVGGRIAIWDRLRERNSFFRSANIMFPSLSSRNTRRRRCGPGQACGNMFPSTTKPDRRAGCVTLRSATRGRGSSSWRILKHSGEILRFGSRPGGRGRPPYAFAKPTVFSRDTILHSKGIGASRRHLKSGVSHALEQFVRLGKALDRGRQVRVRSLTPEITVPSLGSTC